MSGMTSEQFKRAISGSAPEARKLAALVDERRQTNLYATRGMIIQQIGKEIEAEERAAKARAEAQARARAEAAAARVRATAAPRVKVAAAHGPKLRDVLAAIRRPAGGGLVRLTPPECSRLKAAFESDRAAFDRLTSRSQALAMSLAASSTLGHESGHGFHVVEEVISDLDGKLGKSAA